MLGSMGMGIGLTKQSGLPQKFYTLSFDGGDKIAIAYADQGGVFDFGTGDFTVACWFKSSETSTYKAIAGTVADANQWTNAGWRLYTHNGKLAFCCADGSNVAGDTGSFVSSGDVCDGVWHHVAVSVDQTGNTAKLYIDGVNDGSLDIAAVTGNIQSGKAVAAGCFIGDVTVYWNHTCELADLRIYKGTAVTDWADRTTPFTTTATAVYPFSEGTGTTCASYVAGGPTWTLGTGTEAPTWGSAQTSLPPN